MGSCWPTELCWPMESCWLIQASVMIQWECIKKSLVLLVGTVRKRPTRVGRFCLTRQQPGKRSGPSEAEWVEVRPLTNRWYYGGITVGLTYGFAFLSGNLFGNNESMRKLAIR